ncbi:MAG: hypothetical protein ACLUKK_07240 [Lacrimispora saccharolytica]
MRAFNFTKEEKRPYWEDAREYIRASGLPLELDYTAFGICPEGAYVYVLPQKKGKKTQELWELAKQKIRGFTQERRDKPGHREDATRLYARIIIPWKE